ncbi:MAG: NAD(+) diphosphatase [Paludibacteraceae bacterium]|nr:NAD(+) diphosphatase [Paludibacteraceae bacterium]
MCIFAYMKAELSNYIENTILPRYAAFDAGHGPQHAAKVVRESLRLAAHYEVDTDMVYVIAAYHDLGLAENRATHHLVSGRRLREDTTLRQWFSPEQIETMAEAVEDHRASSDHAPRSLYGRLVAEADRDVVPSDILRRTVQYGLSYYPQLDREGHWERFKAHLNEKYAEGGYLKLWIPESDNAEGLRRLRAIIRQPSLLRAFFDQIYLTETHATTPVTVLLQGQSLVIRKDGAPFSENDWTTAQSPASDRFIDQLTGIRTVVLPDNAVLPDEWETVPLRHWFAALGETAAAPAFRARALAHWRDESRYCGCCGHPMEEHPELTARQCPQCGHLEFPRISPCIIVAVRKEGRILLARHVQRNQEIYTCIAGFMEAGESAEAAVQREVMEETGLKVTGIRYRGSQSWPFPGQLMLGFTAEWAGGEIRLQPEEIADARFFDPDRLPDTPAPGSLAWRLIHEWSRDAD